MSEPSPHPTREELSAYSLGQLPQERAVAIDNHISECQSCCETIVGISSDDTFVGLLKQARQLPADRTVDNGVATAPSPCPGIPAQLAEHPRYEVIELMGRGGMGDVYKARHRMMDRTVALKVIKPELIRKPEAVDRFHREVKAAAKLSHPNIVTAYDAEQAGDVHFLVMEYVDGVDLSQVAKDRGALPVAEACEFSRQAAMGLQHAHEQGMVHRDIKPHNLMVTADGTVKILDFGLASLAPEAVSDAETAEARGDLTAAGAIMGTPDFISPEQADDARSADIRSDVYSLGSTLYFLLSGQPPFADGSVMHKLESHATVEPEPLDSVRDDIPADLAAIVSRMMAKDPTDRFQTPAEVAAALETFASGVDLSALGAQANDLPPHDASATSTDKNHVILGNAGDGSGYVVTGGDDHRDSRAWLWLGWVLIATAFVCLGLTIASITTVYDTSALLGGNASELAQSVSGSLRYMIVGAPALLAGIIVLIATYVRRWGVTSGHQPRTARKRSHLLPLAAVATLFIAVIVAGVAYKFSTTDRFSIVAGGAGVDGGGWYLSSGSTYLKQDEPGVLFGMYEDPKGDRSFYYVVLVRHDCRDSTEVSSASKAGLNFDGETASITDGITIDGKGIKLDLELLVDKRQIKSTMISVDGKAIDASQGRLFLLDVTSNRATWSQIKAEFPGDLPAPQELVGDTKLVSEVARQITAQFAKDNDQVRKFLAGVTSKTAELPRTRIAADQPSLRISNDGTWTTHLGTESRSWDLRGNRLGKVVVRLLHVASGELKIASEHEFGFDGISGETAGRVTVVAEGRQDGQLAVSLNVTFDDVSEDGVRTRSCPLIIPRGLLRSGATINVDWDGQRLFPQETNFIHTMILLPEGGNWGTISHRKDDTDSMVEASKKGAQFVAITLDWDDARPADEVTANRKSSDAAVESVDASTAADRAEAVQPTRDDQAATKATEPVVNDAQTRAESDASARRKTTAFLVEAVRRGDTEAVQAALEAGVAPNGASNPLTDLFTAKQLTALHWAVAQRIVDDRTVEPSAEIVKLLIEAGAKVNAADNLGQTPLEWAAKYASPDIVQMLIEAGADVNAESRYGTVLMAGKRTEIAKLLVNAGADVNGGQQASPLANAAKYGNAELIQLLVEKGAKVNDPKDPPIHWAGKPEAAKALLEAGADVNQRNGKGETVLHLAKSTWSPDVETVKLLINAGADVTAKDAADSTPLHAAIQLGKPEIANLLVAAGADVDARDKQGNTPLSVAHGALSWARGNESVDNQPYEAAVQLLVDAGAKDDGRTKLQQAVAAGDLDRVKELIASQVDVNETGPRRITAMHLASEEGDAEILTALIESGANVDAPDTQGMRPLHLAGNAEAARLLIAKGAKVNSGMPSPVYMATMNGRADVVRELLRNDANAKDSDCNTILNWATFAGHLEVVKVLFELREADQLLKVPSTYSPLHVAASGSLGDMSSPSRVTPQQRLSIIKFLVGQGADVNARWGANVNPTSGAAHTIGATPLMFAAGKGDAEIVTFLLEQKADPTAKNASGQTALHFAAQYGHRPVVELLMKAKADVNALTQEAQTPLDLTRDAKVKVLLIQEGGKTASELLKDSQR